MAKNLAIGLGISILVPMAANLPAPIARPLARNTLKAGILTYEKGRETIAEIAEVIDDLVAEVHEELQQERELEARESLDDGARDSSSASDGSNH